MSLAGLQEVSNIISAKDEQGAQLRQNLFLNFLFVYDLIENVEGVIEWEDIECLL